MKTTNITAIDRRFLAQCGVTLEPDPIPVVDGRRYAEVAERNDRLTTELLETRALVDRLTLAREEDADELVKEIERANGWKGFAVLGWVAVVAVVVAAMAVIR